MQSKENYQQPLTRWTKQGTLKNTTDRHKGLQKPGYPANAEVEQAVEQVDKRVRMVKGKQFLAIPNLNRLYDTLGTPNGWRYSADSFATGSITTVANATATVAINVTANAPWKTSMWPGAVQMYPVIHNFSAAPQGAITTAGAISVVYVDNSGITTPLGVFISNTSINAGNDILIPSPITDTGNTKFGVLQFTLTGTTPSTATYSYQLSFGCAYLLPAQKGYEVHGYDHWQEEYLDIQAPNYSGTK